MSDTFSILCVDDERSILRSIKRSFFDKEISTVLVSSGDDALEFLKKNKVDLVISDYMMPGMSGFELLSEIKRKYPLVIRVMLSGYVEKDIVLKSLFDYTSVSFFSKPWDEDILKNRLWELYSLKKSVKNDRLWEIVNNGFPIPEKNIDYSSSPLLKPVKDRKKMEFFVMRNMILYLRLLHLTNSDYIKAGEINVADLIDIPGELYLYEVITDDPSYTNVPARFMFRHVSLIIDFYPVIYAILFGDDEEPSPLPEYISLMNIEKLILLSLSTDLFRKRMEYIKNGGYDFIVDKSFPKLVKLIFKLWHIPDRIFQFYNRLRNAEPEDRMAVTLNHLDQMALAVLSGMQNPAAPHWWKGSEDQYKSLFIKMRDTTM